jgi:hypothetical protein
LCVGDIYEAVRGIFDGRHHLGYTNFSAYYYYARHVSKKKYWIDLMNNKGMEKTAIKMIKTFLSLNDFQKVKP